MSQHMWTPCSFRLKKWINNLKSPFSTNYELSPSFSELILIPNTAIKRSTKSHSRLVVWTLASGTVPPKSMPACRTKYIAWCLRRPIRRMPIESSIFAPTADESRFMHGPHHILTRQYIRWITVDTRTCTRENFHASHFGKDQRLLTAYQHTLHHHAAHRHVTGQEQN